MKVSRQFAVAIAILILQLLPAFADDIITNVMSPVVSYQYYDSFGEDSNATVVSPVVSYQYFDSPDASSVNFLNSPVVSYDYLFSDTPALNILPTSLVPTVAMTTPAYLLSPPPKSQLEIFADGFFTTNPPFPLPSLLLDTNRMTIVLTHGWNSDPNDWATNMAALMVANFGAASPNIVAWDWSSNAQSAWYDLPIVAGKTLGQGEQLGQVLLQNLGSNYSQPIHFIGHSLGTLVNAAAANYLHTNGFAWTNTQITLFDEAEVAVGLESNKLQVLTTLRNGNFSTVQSYYGQPLPNHLAWADNYVSAIGLLHSEAANVILTNGFPVGAPDFSTWWNALVSYHGYPIQWYDETIQTDISAMGNQWSFERGGFTGAPATNTVYIQSGSEWNLVQTSFADGTSFLNKRIESYLGALQSTAGQVISNNITANGQVQGEQLIAGLPTNVFNTVINLFTGSSGGGSAESQTLARPLGLNANNEGSSMNLPAYAWIPLSIPANAVSMSFDFKIQGGWNNDAFAAAFNGTNILLLSANQIGTNILLNSGPIDISAFAGQTNELFVGIVGGTSTNAQLSVQDINFYSLAPPLLQAQLSDNNYVVTWPLSAGGYTLQTTDNIAATNSWATMTNIPVIVNLQNTITNEISGASRFYRLIIQ